MCAISAFEELRELGYLGSECYSLVHRLVREEMRRFSALDRQGLELDDVVQDFLTDRLEAVTVNLAALAGDDASLARLLRRSIRNWLIDRVRKTGIGALQRVVEKVLAEESDFERVPEGEAGAGRWRPVATSSEPWSGPLDNLVAAAWAVPNVRVPRWSSSTRRPPVADRPSLVALTRAVLDAAAGSLEIGQLVAVFARRFEAALDPVVVPLPENQDVVAERSAEPTPEEYVVGASAEVDAATRAAEIVGWLSPGERTIVPYLGKPRSIEDVLGCGPKQAYAYAARLKAKIVQLAGNGDDAHDIVLEVIRLCGGSAEE